MRPTEFKDEMQFFRGRKVHKDRFQENNQLDKGRFQTITKFSNSALYLERVL